VLLSAAIGCAIGLLTGISAWLNAVTSVSASWSSTCHGPAILTTSISASSLFSQ
jgi:hypothetical protein